MSNMKSENVPGNSFRMSKNPDMGNIEHPRKPSLYGGDSSKPCNTEYVTVLYKSCRTVEDPAEAEYWGTSLLGTNAGSDYSRCLDLRSPK